MKADQPKSQPEDHVTGNGPIVSHQVFIPPFFTRLMPNALSAVVRANRHGKDQEFEKVHS
jgi:hypothetical protein